MTQDVFHGREKVDCHIGTIDSTWSSCKAHPEFAAFVQPASPSVYKVLAAAPARCGAASCRSDRKDEKKEKAGRYNLRFVQRNANACKTEPSFWKVFGGLAFQKSGKTRARISVRRDVYAYTSGPHLCQPAYYRTYHQNKVHGSAPKKN